MTEPLQAVILAGGRGTRLAAVLHGLPKPLVPVAGEPLLVRQIAHLAEQGVRDIVLLAGYKHEAIQAHIGDGSRMGVSIRYAIDDPPMGTAGALIGALNTLAPRFVVLSGDTLFDVDLQRTLGWHRARSADVTLFVHPNDHPHDSDLIAADADGRVTAVLPYPHPRDRDFRNLVNAGLYLIEREALTAVPRPDRPTDLAKEMLTQLMAAGRRVFAYRSPEYIKDIGTPDRLAAAERDLASGKVSGCRLDRLRPAVFLDRDGTLNVDSGWIDRPDRMVVLPEAGPAVRRINRAGHLAVVVTNQPVVARGECDEATLDAIHARLEASLGREHAWLDAIHYCPHHPDRGFPGERSELKIACHCRKPSPGLIVRAAEELPIDLGRSSLIGDGLADVGAARAAGIPSIVVGSSGNDPDPAAAGAADFVFSSLCAAADFAVGSLPALMTRARDLARETEPGGWVIIGGPAFAGKTTLARALHVALRERGIFSTLISLDRWIRSAGARDETTVYGRFDMRGLSETVATLADLPGRVTLRVPDYDRRLRRSTPDAFEFSIGPGDTIIFEGVAAFLVDELVRRSTMRVFVDADASVRHTRLAADYVRRGFDLESIERLFAEREREEVALLRSLTAGATTVVLGAPGDDDHHADAS
jgi:D,D-heptose 1,7-bisphosphate phosphatase